jgi:SET domain-containing protein
MTGVEVRESEGRGLGVFATRPFAGGERIRIVKIDREVTEDDPLSPDDNPDHAFLSDGKFLLVGEPDRYLNHCCDPNAYVWYRGTDIDLMARRAIEAGEEITVDYLINNGGGHSWECTCGSPRCRGETAASFFDLPFDIQCEYYPLLAPWFLRQHAARLASVREAMRSG